jgi:hypothetical protein
MRGHQPAEHPDVIRVALLGGVGQAKVDLEQRGWRQLAGGPQPRLVLRVPAQWMSSRRAPCPPWT